MFWIIWNINYVFKVTFNFYYIIFSVTNLLFWLTWLDENKCWGFCLNVSFSINSIITLYVLLICSATTLVGSDNLLSIILLYCLILWMNCFRNDIAFNNIIHHEKLFHAIIDFLVSFTVTLSISDLWTFWADKLIFGSSYIFLGPVY